VHKVRDWVKIFFIGQNCYFRNIWKYRKNIWRWKKKYSTLN